MLHSDTKDSKGSTSPCAIFFFFLGYKCCNLTLSKSKLARMGKSKFADSEETNGVCLYMGRCRIVDHGQFFIEKL